MPEKQSLQLRNHAPDAVSRKVRLTSLYKGFFNKKLFERVETYCMFTGYPRSGHSLIGALLDAHPEAVLSNELDALNYIQLDFHRTQLYQLILENSARGAKEGRTAGGITYKVPGLWSGEFEKLRVIGDKKGGRSSGKLAMVPGLLEKLRETVGAEIRFIHVVRNPYDNISTIYRKSERDANLADSIRRYFRMCGANAAVKDMIPDDAMLDIRQEAFIEDPRKVLRELCTFVGLDAQEEYLKKCASVVYESPNQSRHSVEWDEESIELVRERMSEVDFLAGYSYEN